MNERTVIHHVRRDFRTGFSELAGPDLVKEAQHLRTQQPALSASAIFLRWSGEPPASMMRVVHHPRGVEAPVALVAGRHSKCDLGSIPGASLRHALILLWPPAGGRLCPLAEVIDLGTQTGIALPGRRLAARLASSEPIRFGVAAADVAIVHALAGEPLPVESAAVSELWREIPAGADVIPHSWHLDAAGDSEKSCVAVPVSRSRDRMFGTEHTMLTQVISLGEGHANARVQVREQDLERGVRLGRYRRCRGASALGRDDHVSRVHALVLERGGHRWLFDTASTNGTEVVDLETGVATGPVRGQRTFALRKGQAPRLAGQVALLDVGTPAAPS